MPCNIMLAGMDYMIMNALCREHLKEDEEHADRYNALCGLRVIQKAVIGKCYNV